MGYSRAEAKATKIVVITVRKPNSEGVPSEMVVRLFSLGIFVDLY